MILQVLTDKVHRSVAAIRDVCKNHGGKMADSGSILFKFKRARVLTVKASDVDKDELLILALDAGADDVIEPSMDEDNSQEDSQRHYKIVSSLENYTAIVAILRKEGIALETDSGYELIPITPVEVDDEAMELNKELISKLLELDDSMQCIHIRYNFVSFRRSPFFLQLLSIQTEVFIAVEELEIHAGI